MCLYLALAPLENGESFTLVAEKLPTESQIKVYVESNNRITMEGFILLV